MAVYFQKKFPGKLDPRIPREILNRWIGCKTINLVYVTMNSSCACVVILTHVHAMWIDFDIFALV